jgi:hypothetical protein
MEQEMLKPSGQFWNKFSRISIYLSEQELSEINQIVIDESKKSNKLIQQPIMIKKLLIFDI